MGEVVAQVVEERVPEVMWVDRIIQWRDREGDEFVSVTHTNVDELAKHCRNTGRAYRILRVQPPTPPKKQRVSIDWMKVKVSLATLGDRELSFAWPEIVSAIERHARIVDEEVPNDA